MTTAMLAKAAQEYGKLSQKDKTDVLAKVTDLILSQVNGPIGLKVMQNLVKQPNGSLALDVFGSILIEGSEAVFAALKAV